MKLKKPKLKVLKVERIQCGVLYSQLKATFKDLSTSKEHTSSWLWCDAPEHLKLLAERNV